jgi:outer membrane receptor for ferrienterochelin and colicin
MQQFNVFTKVVMKAFLVLIFVLPEFLAAQKPTATPTTPPAGAPARGSGMGGFKMPSIGRVYGKVLDAGTKKPLEFASITIFLSFGKKDSLVGGGLSLENGDFNVNKLPLGRLKLKITSLGFKEIEKTAILSQPDNIELDLGDFSLTSDAEVLKSVEVTGQKSSLQLGLDKKIFNVDKNINATGGTADEVLKNVPSVTIDNDGNAQLRNQATLVYVDGRPTPMSLNQIPANQIDQIEIITNPSAKYEASATGGIINIIMKKNKEFGYNGFLSAAAGTGRRSAFTGNLNFRQGRWNTTGFVSLTQMKNPTKGFSYRTNFDGNGVPKSFFEQENTNIFNNAFNMARLSVDYTLNNRNTLTAAGNWATGKFQFDDTQNFRFLNANRNVVSSGTRQIVPDNNFERYTAQLIWKKTFPKKNKELTADFQHNFGSSENNGDWFTNGVQSARNTGGNEGGESIFQLDFTNPLNDSTKLETGFRSVYGVQSSRYLLENKRNDAYFIDPTLSQDFESTNMVNAAYLTYSSRFRTWSYQAGLRYEQSNFNAKSNLSDRSTWGFNYPSKASEIMNVLFPSLYLSKKIDTKQEVQVNLSRKLQRPGMMQIMPVIFATDSLNIRQGNPQLTPEFINLAEVNYSRIFGASNWLSTVYFRFEESPIVPFAKRRDDTSLVLINTFINGEQGLKVGFDNILKLQLTKNLELTTNLNVFNTQIQTGATAGNISNSGWALNTKGSILWKLPKDFSVQLSGNYESDQIVPQGIRKEVWFTDFSLKKDFFKIASLTFNVSDIFDTRNQRFIYTTPLFISDISRRRETRFFRLTAQIRFGKIDANMFKSRKQAPKGRSEQQDMDFGG